MVLYFNLQSPERVPCWVSKPFLFSKTQMYSISFLLLLKLHQGMQQQCPCVVISTPTMLDGWVLVNLLFTKVKEQSIPTLQISFHAKPSLELLDMFIIKTFQHKCPSWLEYIQIFSMNKQLPMQLFLPEFKHRWQLLPLFMKKWQLIASNQCGLACFLAATFGFSKNGSSSHIWAWGLIN